MRKTTADEKKAKKREYWRAFLARLKADPEKYKAYITKRREYARRLREELKADPEKYEAHKKYVAASVKKSYHRDVEASRARYRKNYANRVLERRQYDRDYYAAHREERLACIQASTERAAAKLGITVAELRKLRRAVRTAVEKASLAYGHGQIPAPTLADVEHEFGCDCCPALGSACTLIKLQVPKLGCCNFTLELDNKESKK